MNRFFWTVAVLVFSSMASGAEHTKDTLETVKQNIQDGKAVLVDVREADEWQDGHLKDAKLLALSGLKKGIPADELKKTLPKDGIVYLHCGSGRRVLVAADILKKEGYDVRPLKDGYKNLLKGGFPQDK